MRRTTELVKLNEKWQIVDDPLRTCLWCEQPFKCRASGGKAQRFCSPEHRKAFHRAARRWAVGAVEAGVVTVDCLKNPSSATYTFVGGVMAAQVDPDTGMESLRALRRPARGNGVAQQMEAGNDGA